ncbi:hypothetical protein ERD78_08720 [Allopusillimonas soli]|uniref:Uncharacterized protein n=1 Tax=Allopusillimonas soli TaxID=659016 RepID=A0A853FBE1_9BURK|nr:hypothetical protein [Allopusillimonas soli]NYT36952.1 hypothetical protein [Allopusillimonas soli]TEA75403.1 hypothetical protein ERD78_08720 [Allopusillimonas soli]
MMEQELLGLAAAAAGMIEHLAWSNDIAEPSSPHFGRSALYAAGAEQDSWNPLIDDSDAFRLAVKLDMRISIGLAYVSAICDLFEARESVTDDPYEATRRAIVRAAAGCAMRDAIDR